ncbi:mandelate racemase/muconate lactonizing enzyme family protein [Thiosulfatihalobacter marinus]|uniref:mandelate racemase/muconate lactonizing enzyme family protein n=1 Tax=Thiosulfatihalobacter marinus TaxID=2792481 RepID=UPI0018D90014|nr:mandelate racemase/muconate lactonizing enzyme family protein [Thiosulfatihalobacter marinus]
MKITDVNPIVVDAFRANFVFVRIETDEGVHGIGEGTLEVKELALAAAIDMLKSYLVGKDPFAIEHHIETMHRDSYWRTGPVLRSALSAVEAALFDIKGKALGVPVYDLLGGAHRDAIRCYANGWFAGARTPEQFAALARNTVAKGFTALKWDPFGAAYMQIDRAQRNLSMDIMAAVRDAVGPDIGLMIEGHGRFDVPTSIALAQDIARFEPIWFEEPTPPDSIDALAEVRRKSPVAIAAGERFFDLATFQTAIEQGAADYLQPDVSHVGGMLAAKQIAGQANARFLPVCPHNPIGPVANAMTLQIAAACSNVVWLETMTTDVPWRAEIASEMASVENGEMSIPATPGLGVDIDTTACDRYPYQRHDLRHYSGALTDIRPADATDWGKAAEA